MLRMILCMLVVSLTVVVAAEAAKAPVNIVGTSWSGPAFEGLKVSKLGKDGGLEALTVTIPSQGQWTSADGEGGNYSGTWTAKGSKFTFMHAPGSLTALEGVLATWIEALALDEGVDIDVTVDITKQAAAAKVKGGEMKFRSKYSFVATGGGQMVKGKYAEKGILMKQ